MRQTISGVPLDATGEPGDPSLTPYRRWALQTNVISLLGNDAEWGALDGHPRPRQDAETLTQGNAALLEQLQPDPEIGRRVRAMALMWLAAFLLETVNHFTPIGIKDSDAGYMVVGGMVLFALVITLTVFSRLTFRQFVVWGLFALVYAYTLIAIKVAGTGGVGSPYAPLWVLVTLYCAYFLPRRRALPNFALIAVAMLAPFAYDEGYGTEAAIYLAVLTVACMVLAQTVLAGRELTRGADRAVRYLALADPLTGLANLRSFEAAVERGLLQKEERFAIVLVEIDGLKGANLAFGQEAGDDMLRRLAGLLSEACGERDQAARVRGHEFAVLLPGAGTEGAREWLTRFDRLAASHNEWARGRLPRIAVETSVAVYPEDGTRLSSLTEVADRRLVAAKNSVVQPPHEVDAAGFVEAEQLLGGGLQFEDPRIRHFRRAPSQSAFRWLLAGLALLAYLIPSDLAGRNETAVVALAAVSGLFAAGGFVAQRAKNPLAYLWASDVATLAVIAPFIWATGGWQSPLQAAVIFPITFYAQFISGRQATVRIAIAIGMYALAFWTSELVGVVDGPPGPVARTLFLSLMTALVVITVILQRSLRETDDALAVIRDSAEHDPLTGVFNLHAFRSKLDAMIARASSAEQSRSDGGENVVPALLIADVNDLRGVNRRSGQLVGDAVLKAIAERLSRTAAGRARVYRIDSSKFALLMKAEARETLERFEREVRTAASGPDGAGRTLPEEVGVSVGIAIWSRGRTAYEMVDEAATAVAAERALRSSSAVFGDGATLL